MCISSSTIRPDPDNTVTSKRGLTYWALANTNNRLLPYNCAVILWTNIGLLTCDASSNSALVLSATICCAHCVQSVLKPCDAVRVHFSQCIAFQHPWSCLLCKRKLKARADKLTAASFCCNSVAWWSQKVHRARLCMH